MSLRGLSYHADEHTCRIAFSAATRADFDQAISISQGRQIGAASCSIDRLSLSIATLRKNSNKKWTPEEEKRLLDFWQGVTHT
jgi:hypothetical protein